MRCALYVLLFGLVACTQTEEGPPREEDPRPSIVVFFTDDHGYADLGIQSPDGLALTPHTDALAREGVRMVHGYVTAPQCAPSRAGLLTGIYQGRFGFESNRDGPLAPELHTLAERLQEAGYRTGMAGKWHLGVDQNNRERLPAGVDESRYTAAAQGFDEIFEGQSRQFLATHTADGQRISGGPRLIQDERFRIDAATEWGLHFIRRHAQRPFLLYLPYFAPHVPLEAPQADLDLFPGVEEENRRTALAMIHAMDRGVGRIREALAAAGLSQNTLIVYLGDNGAPVTPAVANGSLNTPLRGEKGMLTDGGIRVPYVLHWPGQVAAGQAYSGLVSSLDIAATVLAAADLPADPQLDGLDLRALLQGAIPPREALYWRWMSQAAVRIQDWKFIRLGDGRRFLFDLREDAAEGENVLEQFPEQAAALEQQLQSWAEGLQPPGLPEAGISQMESGFYSFHGLN